MGEWNGQGIVGRHGARRFRPWSRALPGGISRATSGVGLGEGCLILDSGIRIFDGEAGRFTYILNGRALTSVHNQLIASEDRLLISYGLESMNELGEGRFGRVATTAGEYNMREDPATCSGSSEPLGMWGRLKLAFWG